MDDKYLRYVSLCALLISDSERVLVGNREEEDEFFPGDIVFPSGRVEGGERIMTRFDIEVEVEAGIPIVGLPRHYLGDCTFPRDGYPVTQLCYGVEVGKNQVLGGNGELVGLRFLTMDEFREQVPNEGYQTNLHRFVQAAVENGLIRTQ